MSDEDDWDCPLCMEEMDISDKNFKPCPCGYQICRFCWNHIKQNLNGKCPACRRDYSDQIVEFTPVTPADVQRFKNEKRQKDREKKEMEANNRRHLANTRVVQKNLVYIIGLSSRISTEELLRQHDYFGQYGKILKVVVNKRNLGGYNQVQQNSKSEPIVGVYVTFAKKDEAAKCISAIDGTVYEGRVLRASYGTTKYCSFYLRGLVCQNPGCMYLHEPGEEADSFTKEEMSTGRHHQNSKLSNGIPAAPGSPGVGEAALSAPAAPFGVNAPSVNPIIGDDSRNTASKRSISMPADSSDEWPAPSTTNTQKSGQWLSRQSSYNSTINSGERSEGNDRISCDIFKLIHPSSAPVCHYKPIRPSAEDSKGLINTSQFHRYLILAHHSREYYMQISNALFQQQQSQIPGNPVPLMAASNLFVFNPFKNIGDSEQSRFGFAQQKSGNYAESVSELTERFNRISVLHGTAAASNRSPPVPTGLGMNVQPKQHQQQSEMPHQINQMW